MALTKTVTSILSGVTVAANGVSSASSVVDLTEAIDLAVEFSITFGSATSGYATIELYGGSTSGFTVSDYDQPTDAADVPVNASRTVKGVAPLNKSAKYMRVRVRNNSSTSITSVAVSSIVQKP